MHSSASDCAPRATLGFCRDVPLVYSPLAFSPHPLAFPSRTPVIPHIPLNSTTRIHLSAEALSRIPKCGSGFLLILSKLPLLGSAEPQYSASNTRPQATSEARPPYLQRISCLKIPDYKSVPFAPNSARLRGHRTIAVTCNLTQPHAAQPLPFEHLTLNPPSMLACSPCPLAPPYSAA